MMSKTLSPIPMWSGRVLLTPMSCFFTDHVKMGGQSQSPAVKMEEGF